MKLELTVREELDIWISIKVYIREERKCLRTLGVQFPEMGYICIERLTRLRHLNKKF